MKSITIKGSQRESVGKVATKALRNAGQVPCVYTEETNHCIFQHQKLHFKNLCILQIVYTATIELDGQKIALFYKTFSFIQ